ncbi:site-specific recombinase XerD [Rhodopseudomonas faecalis]|uniref:Site-specific recombinase XerD n=1 Tax=Rhodopseudomonas faecalis TaxID=99655 RepID=A0A318TL34_9BRAD|nr:site-specific integrase [Rhodopseudomonas faecalis]PYF02545.1 site-specific recombinase XerD [Rhodopseudomonas faecalis]
MRKPLSAVAITGAKPKPKRYAITDVGHPGLRLLVYPSGEKSFAFRYKRPDTGRDVTLTLGPAAGPGAITLSQARDLASDARRKRATGDDPAATRRAERAAKMAQIEAEEKEARRRDNVVALVLDRYYRDKVNGMKSAGELKRLLSKELGVWSKRRVDDISRADAIRLIDAIKDRGTPVLANRTRAAARTFFGWCIDKALIEENPFERTKPVATETPRDRTLSDPELRVLLLAIDRMDWPWRPFFRLLLILGQRRDEVAGMNWEELDLASTNPVWVLPATRSKNGREHAIPLPPQAVAILSSIDRVHVLDSKTGKLFESPFVFTTTGKTPISGFSNAKERLDADMRKIACEEAEKLGIRPLVIAPWRLHDFRRSIASGMAELGVSVSVAEKVMNHVSGTFAGIVGVYQRHDFFAEKRHALNLWADHLSGLTAPRQSNVVQFKTEA